MSAQDIKIINNLMEKKWSIALRNLDEILNNKNMQPKLDNEIFYLMWRSQCFFELGRHEECVTDCKKLIGLLPSVAPGTTFWFSTCWRLTHSLLHLKRFEEARQIAESLCADFRRKECANLVKRIDIIIQLANSEKKEDKNDWPPSRYLNPLAPEFFPNCGLRYNLNPLAAEFLPKYGK